MNNQIWSWLLTVVGVTGFILAGRKVWWCWYINIGCQALWVTYAIVTDQWGFIVASAVYTVVFTQNAIKWTREHNMLGLDEAFSEWKEDELIDYAEKDAAKTEELYEATRGMTWDELITAREHSLEMPIPSKEYIDKVNAENEKAYEREMSDPHYKIRKINDIEHDWCGGTQPHGNHAWFDLDTQGKRFYHSCAGYNAGG